MTAFSLQIPRVVFGEGSLDYVESEIGLLGARRALVLSTPQRRAADDVARRLGGRCAGIFDRAVMHVPIETARAAREEARKLDADCAVAVGGGSTIGLAKAIALESALPILAIPTTYSGSEMTPIYGLTEAGQKKTGRDARVLPRTVIYDPVLTASLPPKIAATSGVNAIAHACEGLYAHDAGPIHLLLAEEGIRALAEGLPQASARCLYGAWLCGAVLGGVAMGLHHKLCHTLGGTFNLPHAETHTAVLPHALAYNRAAAPEAMRRIAAALGASDAPGGVYDLARRLGASMALRDLGMPETGLDRAADLAVSQAYPNPRPLERAAIRQLLQDAWEGRRPG
jgi:maleylacetate reductase